MRLHNLKPRPGAKHRTKRLGLGESSGHGKTSGRGGKGQSARSGSSNRHGFEGGQMPLIRRMPKRGFNNKRHAIQFAIVNISQLAAFDNGSTVDFAVLKAAGIISGSLAQVKVLGTGEIDRKLKVCAAAFSKAAKEKIEKAGGTCELLG